MCSCVRRWALALALVAVCTANSAASAKRKVIIDQDCSGPGGSNMQTLLLLIQSPEVEVLGITVVTGNAWRDEEVARTLRVLEIIGRTDIAVVPGAAFPLMRRPEEAKLWQERYGKVGFAGAWDPRWWHEPLAIPELAEEKPVTKPSEEDAAHFLVRMVHQFPSEVTIYEGGPMTDLALAISIDPKFPRLAQGLIFMGGSISPQASAAEFANNPRHEFNFWLDPEAAHIVLRAPWNKIVCTPVDISVKTRLTPEMIREIEASGTPLARYVARFYQTGEGAEYMWDELAAAAWIHPELITKRETRYMDVSIDHGAGYGNTLTWNDQDRPKIPVQPVEIQMDLQLEQFDRLFVKLMTAPTPKPAVTK